MTISSPHQPPRQARGLAIYIHWPFCKSKCPYCDFNSHVRESVDQKRWRDALRAELDTMASHVPDRVVASIFFGGGTPSLMPPETAGALIARVKELWPVTDDIEITLEANPTSVEINTFRDFAAVGINRVSLGVQSLDDKELQFLGRGHSAKEAIAAIELAREVFARYTFDLIYARPNQTVAMWEQELKEALRYAGTHLSLYQLTIEENTAFHHAYAKGKFTLPNEEESEALYRLTEAIMAAHGLPAYEVSNYATPGHESRHNLAYWKYQDYIGVGPGAHGRISPAEWRGPVEIDNQPPQQVRGKIATQTIKSPERWLESVSSKGNGVELWDNITPQHEAEERLMMGLRLVEGIDDSPFRDVINSKRRELFVREGLLENTPDKLQTTLKGRLVLNRLTAELLS
jgi:putative oxygen-independent coproporphyrinogen III oxidase